MMKVAASSRVTIWRPRGRGIGSSNGRFQPRSATIVPRRADVGAAWLGESPCHFPFASTATSIAFQSSLLQVFGMQTLIR